MARDTIEVSLAMVVGERWRKWLRPKFNIDSEHYNNLEIRLRGIVLLFVGQFGITIGII